MWFIEIYCKCTLLFLYTVILNSMVHGFFTSMWLCVVKKYIVKGILNEVAPKTSQRTTKGVRIKIYYHMLAHNLPYNHSYIFLYFFFWGIHNCTTYFLSFYSLINCHCFNSFGLGLILVLILYKEGKWERSRCFSCGMKISKEGTCR